jgi:predicted Ser/Thr protein kinase
MTIVENASKLTIGTRIYANVAMAEFEVTSELGRGNFGVVSRYRFRGVDIAIKVLICSPIKKYKYIFPTGSV